MSHVVATPAIDVMRLTRKFGDFTALDAVSFRVEPGTVFGLLGLNGAGKTTMIRILTTLLRPTSGSAHVLGRDVTTDATAVRRAIGFVGEDSGLSRLDWLVPHYLEYFGGLYGLDRDEVRKRAQPRLEALLPIKFVSAPLDTLSAGMRKKVEIVRALLARPRLLILDEPTKELDIPTKQEIWSLLRDLARAGTTVVITSHDALEIEATCERLCVLREGRVAFDGRTDSLPSGIEFAGAVSTLLAGPGTSTESARASGPRDKT